MFFGALGYTQHRIDVELRTRAASYIDLIVSTRQWIALHEGVYVYRDADSPSNPYLAELGIDPDIVAGDGRVLTMRNPAIVTRELAELARNRFGVVFRIISDEPVNPGNTADEWERVALAAFRAGEVSASVVEGKRGAREYRYMEPLHIEEPCLRCHGSQGYEVGDLRGGISVGIPYEPVRELMLREAGLLGLLALVSGVLLLGTMGVLASGYRIRLEESAREIERMASTDPLTELHNRWVALARLREEVARSRRTGEPLAVLMIDIDRFKQVNDTAGHAAGDEVLREVARRITTVVRDYDVTARIGGEEFLVIAPGTDMVAAETLAERVGDAVRKEPIVASGTSFSVSVSIGLTDLRADDVGDDDILRRADEALYEAKDAGRDRTRYR